MSKRDLFVIGLTLDEASDYIYSNGLEGTPIMDGDSKEVYLGQAPYITYVLPSVPSSSKVVEMARRAACKRAKAVLYFL